MTPTLKIGQALKGVKDTYSVAKQLHDKIWSATSTSCTGVVVKTAPKSRLHREQEILRRFQGHPCIRQLVDHVDDPPYLVLEQLERDASKASGEAKLARSDIKLIARNILEALKSLHEEGIAHTDVKPDNVLLNFDSDGARVVEAKLADFGDAWDVGHDVDPKGEGHIIGAAIFRSPEAMLQMRWATPTVIWSFGATLISLIWGKNWHMFKPTQVSADDEEYPTHVLIQQARFFGPFPLSYEDAIDAEQNRILAAILYYIEEHN
ncbi:hypothetical protein B0A49_00544 [Cryomyces minteri]|uniref:Protein kinase domain-containing protein n=1 Tax=Cryomyces minteri TaxID=331657 RepID=A0A4U0XUK5_9PEZI|nr:hypothetical protein B0A49_02396 [Cryomyces minteri]TKA81492.1 hypothetical protein B0A49_00544 [Cryomyces minteri]